MSTPVPEPEYRPFFTGPIIKTDLLLVWLEKHGIEAVSEPADSAEFDENDLSREMKILVRAADYDRAHQLFFAEREDEL